jgi:hypothetical protein
LLVAHLNSAAIRLCTINERFRSDEKREIMKDYFACTCANFLFFCDSYSNSR